MKIELSAGREGVTTVFTAGDHVSSQFFPEFVEAVRNDNAVVLAARSAGTTEVGAKRKNQKLLRQLAPLAVSHGWLAYTEAQNDAVLYSLWRDLATGAKVTRKPALTAENLDIIRQNWTLLAAAAPEFSYKTLPDEPLLKLIPQGKPANPIYLPAPDEVIKTGLRDFTAKVPAGELTMGQRYQKSLGVISFASG